MPTSIIHRSSLSTVVMGPLARFTIENGIEICLDDLDSVSIVDNGQTATVGGGALSEHITDALWEKGKQKITGLYECTSLLGPGLGGGHEVLQGWYGLIADYFVSLDIILANGSLITADERSDLW
jgi:FAD/FMN-containing dehydrogenase